MLGFKYTISILESHMGEDDYIKEPLWHLDLRSRVRTRNERMFWGWLIIILPPFIITYLLGY